MVASRCRAVGRLKARGGPDGKAPETVPGATARFLPSAAHDSSFCAFLPRRCYSRSHGSLPCPLLALSSMLLRCRYHAG